MKHVLKTLALATAMALGAGAAQAEVIDFEASHGLDTSMTGFAPFLVDGDFVMQGNYGLTPFTNAANGGGGDLIGALVDGSDLSMCFGVVCPTNNPTTFYAGLNDGVFALQNLGGKAFTVDSFDASFIGGQGAVMPAVSGLLRLQGITATGASMTQTFQLAGPNAAGALSFSNYATSGAFAHTQFTTVYAFGFACAASGSCNAFTTDRGQFAMDNINVTAVPEPETLALFGAGLAVLAAVRRRRLAA